MFVAGFSTGTFFGSPGSIVVYKMDPRGNILQVKTPYSNEDENVFGILGKESKEGSSTIFVCGSTWGDLFGTNGGGQDGYIFALNGDTFEFEWTLQITDSRDGELVDMTWDVTDTNYIFAVGRSDNNYTQYSAQSAGKKDIWLLKIDARDGSIKWMVLFGSPQEDVASSVTVDFTGAIFISGSIGGSIPNWNVDNAGGIDGIVIRLSHSGVVQWVTQIATAEDDGLHSVVPAGNLVITSGYTFGNLSEDGTPQNLTNLDEYYYHGVLCAMDTTDGTIQWLQLEVASGGFVEYNDLAYSDNIIYAIGNLNGQEFRNRTRTSYDFDIILALYNMSGELLYLEILGTEGEEAPQALFLASDNSVYAAGWTTGSFGGNNLGGQDFLTVRALPPSVPSHSKPDNQATILIAVLCTVVPLATFLAFGGFMMFNRMKINQKRRQQQQHMELQTMDSQKPEKPEKPKSEPAAVPKKVEPATAKSESEKKKEPSEEDKWKDFWELDYSEIRLGKELGRGAFGVVYKADWRNSECVVKQAQLGTNENKNAMIAFLKEAEAIRNLRNHRNVCSILGVCTNPSYPICIVMQYCNGGNLENAIRSGKIQINEKNLIRISKDVCSGMSHIHKENILHLDLACRNLLVDFEGSDEFAVKISDFGLSRVTENGKIYATQDTMFSFRWTPPEGFKQMKFTRATDIWAFGVVLWEIIELQVPYGSMTNTQVMDYVVNQKKTLTPPTRVQYPPVFYEIMQMCWSFDPTQRPTFDELFQLFRHLENTGNSQESQEIQEEDNRETQHENTYTERLRPVYGRKSTNDIPIPNATYINNSLDSYV